RPSLGLRRREDRRLPLRQGRPGPRRCRQEDRRRVTDRPAGPRGRGPAVGVRDGMGPMTTSPTDPYAWLEDVEAADALSWARGHNDEAVAALGTERFERLQAQILEVLDSTDKIPAVVQRGDHLYNFWTDAD